MEFNSGFKGLRHFLDIISYPPFPRKFLSGKDLARAREGATLGVSSMGAGGIIPFARMVSERERSET